MSIETSPKVTASQLKRSAFLYIRQSTPRQVLEHTESTARQYALRKRAIALGWHGDQVITIDSDLGRPVGHRQSNITPYVTLAQSIAIRSNPTPPLIPAIRTWMIETGNYKNFDKVIVVASSIEDQKQRLRSRAALSEEQIEARIRSQMPTEEKYADYVIDNSKALADTRRQVATINSELRELAVTISGRRRS
jgi:hypothetical protein